MDPAARTCEQCAQEFAFAPEETAFFGKIAVPPPTWCPKCRLQRRLSFRNERTLYKRGCGLCGNQIISVYHEQSSYQVYCQSCWWSDGWDPLEYGRKYDFSKPFFEQYRELQLKVPRLALVNTNSINSEYTNYAGNNKNCYLIFSNATGNNENCAYGTSVSDSRDSFDLINIYSCELVYDGADCQRCYNVTSANYCFDCRDCTLVEDCKDCQDCIGCKGLRGKRYCILNKQYSKEEYEQKAEQLGLETREGYANLRVQFEQLRQRIPNKFAHIVKAENCTGDYVANSKNCAGCFDTNDSENSRFLKYSVKRDKECQDVCYVTESELGYETLSLVSSYNCRFCNTVWWGVRNLEYCELSFNSENLFGCVSLKKNQYCILNKQYSKEEYEEMVPRIKQQMAEVSYMDPQGRAFRYGQFFPLELSPFAYNETIAQEYFPLTKMQAESAGYRWREEQGRNHQVTLQSADIPSTISEVDESITAQVIACEHKGQCHQQCTFAFRVTSQEFQFYLRKNLPLPSLCPNCRHYERLAKRNSLTLWERQCQCAGIIGGGVYENTVQHIHGSEQCLNTFQTTYAPEMSSIVYCKGCYQTEIA